MPGGGLKQWLARLRTSDSDLDASELRDMTVRTGCSAASKAGAGDKVELAGRLRAVTIAGHDGAPALTAELFDGTAVVNLVWLGRRVIAGIAPGRSLRVVGRIALAEGRKVIYNPRYTLLDAES